MLTTKEMEMNAGQALVVCQYSMLKQEKVHRIMLLFGR